MINSVKWTRALTALMLVLVTGGVSFTSGQLREGPLAKQPAMDPSLLDPPASGTVGAQTFGFTGCVFSANRLSPKWCSPGLVGKGALLLNRGWTAMATVTEVNGPFSQAIVVCPRVSGIQFTAQAGGCHCTNSGTGFLQASYPVFYNGNSLSPNTPTSDCRTSGVASNCNAWYCACYNQDANAPAGIRIQANCLKLI